MATSSSERMERITHVVADAGAFLKNAKLQDIGDNIYTLRNVVAEIKDEKTRQRLAVLPYELQMVEPNAESLAAVTAFAKKTGDFPVLSATDLRVLAVTHMLELRHNGSKAAIRTEPNIVSTYGPNDSSPTATGHAKMAGFHYGKGKEPAADEQHVDAVMEDKDVNDSESGDEDDWITPSNLVDTLRQMNADHLLASSDDDGLVSVACLTTDFAMQNVLLHMGLKVVSMDGVLIRRLKSYVLRCRACNGFLVQDHQVDDEEVLPKVRQCCFASMRGYGRSGRDYKVPPVRQMATDYSGMRHSLPAPKGGKHGNDPLLCEDQPVPHNRLSRKAMEKVDPLSDEFFVGDSPFATKDTTSRSAMLGVRGMQKPDTKKNPNAYAKGKKRGGKKR